MLDGLNQQQAPQPQLIDLTIGGKQIKNRRHFVSESAGANRWFLLN